MRMQIQSPASLSGLSIWCCCELWCRLQTWLRSILLCLWCRPAATVLMAPLAWEPPYAAWPKKKKKKESSHYLTLFHFDYNMICGSSVWIHLVWGPLCFLYLDACFLYIWKVFNHNFPKYIFNPLSFFFSSGNLLCVHWPALYHPLYLLFPLYP